MIQGYCVGGKNYIGIISFTAIILILTYIYYFTEYAGNNEILIMKLIQAAVVILIAYLLIAFVDDLITKRVSDIRGRYTFRKVSSVFISLITAGTILIIFMKETTTLIVAYGILSAGVVITLQDVFRNFAGGVFILFSKSFRPGDRIQVGDCYGDVIDVTYFHTTLMENREWVRGDLYSGRIIHIPNSFILNRTIKNYTKDFSFIWDEVTIILAPTSDWKKAKAIALETVNEVIEDYVEHSKRELSKMEKKYMLTSYDVDTRVFMNIEGDRIEMGLRYVVDPKRRRHVNDQIVQNLLERFVDEPDIIIGSISSIEITKIPPTDNG